MEDAWDKGYDDALNGKPYSNPYKKDDVRWDDYHEGFSYGTKELNYLEDGE